MTASAWVLVLLLVKTDGTGQMTRFGPFTSIGQCQRAGTSWLEGRVAQSDVYMASWDCRQIQRNK